MSKPRLYGAPAAYMPNARADQRRRPKLASRRRAQQRAAADGKAEKQMNSMEVQAWKK